MKPTREQRIEAVAEELKRRIMPGTSREYVAEAILHADPLTAWAEEMDRLLADMPWPPYRLHRHSDGVAEYRCRWPGCFGTRTIIGGIVREHLKDTPIKCPVGAFEVYSRDR